MTDAAPSYDEFMDALADGSGFYLRCPEGHGMVPPQRYCRHCGSSELHRSDLLTSGHVVSYTEISVPIERFADRAPYITAIVDLGPVRLTGIVTGDDPPSVGQPVDVDVEGTAAERVLVFHPA